MDVDGSVCVHGPVCVWIHAWTSVWVDVCSYVMDQCGCGWVSVCMGQFVCVDTCLDECVGGCMWLCDGSVFGYNACIAITNCDLDGASELNKHEI